jgi:hypothetical protein
MGFNFSLFGILGLVLYAGCIFHAIKTGRINYWLFILIFLPGLGSIAYLLLEVLPGLRNSRAAQRRRAASAPRSIPTGACARAPPTSRSSTPPRTGASSPRSA